MHGTGKFYWNDGTVYEGEFKNGYPHGIGKMIISDLSVYDGHFCNGYFHGDGTYNLVTTQLIYNGQWKNGKRHGKLQIIQLAIIIGKRVLKPKLNISVTLYLSKIYFVLFLIFFHG